MTPKGTFTALVTPMDQDFRINLDGLRQNIDFQIANGVDGLVPMGTTGQSPTLSWVEHDDVVGITSIRCRGKCMIVAGTGSNSTEEAIKSTQIAVRNKVEAVLLVDCYYNGPSSQELRDEYYAAIAADFPGLTIIPYVIPGRSGTALEPVDLALLAARFPGICAIKEATGDLKRMAYERYLVGDDFSILSGDDDITLQMITDPNIKANGVISVLTNIIPASIVQMVNSAMNGEMMAARGIMGAIQPLLQLVTVRVENTRVLPYDHKVVVNDRYRNPVPIHTIMNGLGMPAGPVRRPLGKMSEVGVEEVRSSLQWVWEHNPEVLEPIGAFYGVDLEDRINDLEIWRALTA